MLVNATEACVWFSVFMSGTASPPVAKAALRSAVWQRDPAELPDAAPFPPPVEELSGAFVPLPAAVPPEPELPEAELLELSEPAAAPLPDVEPSDEAADEEPRPCRRTTTNRRRRRG
ncbi:hypothetical protein [Streptomyces sp. NBC_01180]|uniref:hypothetical protein n=1 Tax=Streptomyces sp. NBC_01180 TaxID=2903763 RepID=UPI003866C00E|nr:hypothetical protein OG708_01855 [Streptomyces sp. NBC_01180]